MSRGGCLSAHPDAPSIFGIRPGATVATSTASVRAIDTRAGANRIIGQFRQRLSAAVPGAAVEPQAPVASVLALAGHDDGNVGCLGDRGADRSQQHSGESAAAVTTDHDELG